MKICIDPGHGNPDSGAVGSHSKESDINLAVCLLINDNLTRSGINVIMTRKDSNMLNKNNTSGDLQARCDIANNNNVDYFISVHCNSAGNTSARGTECYCYKTGGTGEKLAKALQSAIVGYTQLPDRGVKTANFYVIHNTKMPAVLIELLFISNIYDEQKLNDPAFQKGIAQVISETVCKYTGMAYIPEKLKHAIMGESEATADQMEKFVHTVNPIAPYLADSFIKIGKIEGVRGDIAYAQSIEETGYFRYGGIVSIEQNNYCGLGATGNSKGASFKTPEDGITAQIQHLKAYASNLPLSTEVLDPRFNLVQRGSAVNWEDLDGKWAVPGNNYGEDIINLWNNIKKIKIDNSDSKNSLTEDEIKTMISLLTKLLNSLKEV